MLTAHFDGHDTRRGPDELIVEEPLEIRLDDPLVATTMRTPGHDFELAAGFCFTDGLLAGAPVQTCRYCGTGSAVDTEFNVVSRRDRRRGAPCRRPRLTTTTSSCGLCGSPSIDELADRLEPLDVGPTLSRSTVLAAVPRPVRAEQELFAVTGAVHAAAAFDRDGRRASCAEDIGRHNAVDKVVGRLLLDGALPATELGLLCQRPGVVRDRAEGVGRRLRHGGGGERPLVARGRDRPAGRCCWPGSPATARSTSTPSAARVKREHVGRACRPTASASRSPTTTARWPRWRGTTGPTRSTRGTC